MTIGLCGVEREVLDPALFGLDHHEPTLGVTGERIVVLAGPPQGLVAAVGRVMCADDP